MLDVLSFKKYSLIIVLLVIPLFFIGGPSSVSLEIYRRVWDLGHPMFFGLVAVNLVWWRVIKTKWHFILASIAILCVSLLIEKIQSYIGREASWLDVLANISGFILGYGFAALSGKTLMLSTGLALIGLLPGLWALLKSLALVLILWSEFPILSDGKNVIERQVWGGAARVEQIRNQSPSGYRIYFSGDAFQAVDRMEFIQSWEGFQKLVLEIQNPSNDTFKLTLRISDRQHELSEQDYEDRFNQALTIHPGNNRVEVSTDSIRNAPAGRQMDLSNIYLLKLFLLETGPAREIVVTKIVLQ